MGSRRLSKLEECRDCVCLALRRSARRITQGYDVALAGTGLRATQFSLLVMVHHLGTPTMKAVARTLSNDPTTITRNIQALGRRRLLSLFPWAGFARTQGQVDRTRREDPPARFAQLAQGTERCCQPQSRRADPIALFTRAGGPAPEQASGRAPEESPLTTLTRPGLSSSLKRTSRGQRS